MPGILVFMAKWKFPWFVLFCFNIQGWIFSVLLPSVCFSTLYETFFRQIGLVCCQSSLMPKGRDFKSDNLQYNTLGRWDDRLIDQVSDVPSIFFHNFLQNFLQKSFQFIFLFLYKFTKIKIKSFECPKSIRKFLKQ